MEYLGRTGQNKDIVNKDYLEEYLDTNVFDDDGKVKSQLLPSYVDDVLEYANKASFPASGESGKIYVDLSTNLTYRWGGSAYVEISPSLALGETSSTAYEGSKGKANADAITALQGRMSSAEGNFANYLPLTGGALTGGINLANLPNTSPAILLNNSGSGTIGLTFGTNTLVIKKWGRGEWMDDNVDILLGSSSHKVLHSGNFNSYAPKLDGTGASGTWGINITGSAAKLNGLDSSYYSSKQSETEDLTDNSGASLLPRHTTAKGKGSAAMQLEGKTEVIDGTLVSVQPTIKTTGRNIWDEEWESGQWYYQNGAINKGSNDTRIRSKNYIPVLPNTTYYHNFNSTVFTFTFDAQKNCINTDYNGYTWYSGREFTTPNNCAYILFFVANTPTYAHDICINISDTSFNGQYEPYHGSVKKWKSPCKENFNLWDEEWEVVGGNLSIIPKNPICVKGLQSIYISFPVYGCYWWVDKNGKKNGADINEGNIDGYCGSVALSVPTGAEYILFSPSASYGTTYKNDICINESDPAYNGQYVPYGGTAYFFPNGLCSAGSVKDEDKHGKATKRIGAVDLGSLNWAKYGNYWYNQSLIGIAKKAISEVSIANIVCGKYPAVSKSVVISSDKCIAINQDGEINIADSSYADAASFKAAMSGVMLYFELATPLETESNTDNTFEYEEGGMETFEGNSLPPQGEVTYYHDVQYHDDWRLSAKAFEGDLFGSASHLGGLRAEDYATKALYLSKADAAATYLPLTGGTLNNGTNSIQLAFNNGSTTLGDVGCYNAADYVVDMAIVNRQTTKFLVVGDSLNSNELTYGAEYSGNRSIVYHSGNSNKSDVDWSCSTLNAHNGVVVYQNDNSEYYINNSIISGIGRIYAYRTSYGYQTLYLGSYEGSVGMTILGGGNVGIGTTSPAYKLDVHGALSTKSVGLKYNDVAVSSGGAGWYRVFTSSANDAVGGNTILFINHGYNYSETESYVLSVSRGFANKVQFTQISGNSVTEQQITKARVAYNATNEIWYIDIYITASVTRNTYCCNGIGNGTFQVPTKVTTEPTKSIEFALTTGMSVSSDLYVNGTIHATGGIYSDSYVSAGGQNSSAPSGNANVQPITGITPTTNALSVTKTNPIGTENVIVVVYDSNNKQVLADVTVSASTITFSFTTTGTYHAIVIGSQS